MGLRLTSATDDTTKLRPPLAAQLDFTDQCEFTEQCECGHTRGEHFTPTGGLTDRCLIQGCDCFGFRPSSRGGGTEDGSAISIG